MIQTESSDQKLLRLMNSARAGTFSEADRIAFSNLQTVPLNKHPYYDYIQTYIESVSVYTRLAWRIINLLAHEISFSAVTHTILLVNKEECPEIIEGVAESINYTKIGLRTAPFILLKVALTLDIEGTNFSFAFNLPLEDTKSTVKELLRNSELQQQIAEDIHELHTNAIAVVKEHHERF